jgi:glycosyltransferase involved in cell wall biosynthesis
VSPFSPHPLNFGGAIRLFNLLRIFSQFSDVSLVCFEPWKGWQPPDVLHELCKEVVVVPRPSHSQTWVRLRSIFSVHSVQYLADHSRDLQNAIDDIIHRRRFDVTIAEMSQMASYDLTGTAAVRILDLQNIEHELTRRRAAVGGRGLRRLALELEWRKLRREELSACKRFDIVFMPSDRERELMTHWAPSTVHVTVPNAIDPDRLPLRKQLPLSREVVFVGLTQVDANRDGVSWFVDSVLPLIEDVVPDVHFTVVGGTPPPSIAGYGARANIDVTGYVEDVHPYFERAAVSVVPLRSGGGTRLKILEALCVGVPTVSTTIGAEGLELENGVHIRIADDAESFAAAVVELVLDPELQARMSEAGSAEVRSTYSWQAQRDHVESVVRAMLPH